MSEVFGSPIFLIFVTVAGYQLGVWLRQITGGHPLAQPVLVSITVSAVSIRLLGVDYPTYYQATQWIWLLLGPATVALAVPLHRQLSKLHGVKVPLLLGLPLGALVSVTSGYLLVLALGGPERLALSLAPKTATAPVAMAVAESAGGVPAIAAVLAVTAGTFGAVAGPTILTLVRVRDRRARGLAMGSVSHGIGAARSLHDNETEGAFAGLAMGVTALLTSVVMPLVVWLF